MLEARSQVEAIVGYDDCRHLNAARARRGAPLEYAPEAVTPAALLVRGESGSLLETVAVATKGQPQSRRRAASWFPREAKSEVRMNGVSRQIKSRTCA
jgi:hypothetical protein